MSKKHPKNSSPSTKKSPTSSHHSDAPESAQHPTLSILVPIYNTEKYLRQCLDSLINQTFTDLEIICINDGSTDSSLDIIKEYQAQDSRIVLINKENTGYGDSMNQGLKKARGEYIGILEPDDWIELDAYEKLLTYAIFYQAEVIRANYFFHKNHRDRKNSYIYTPDAGRPLDPHRHTWIFYEAPAIWSALYRRDFLTQNDIKFLPTPGASYQDTGFNFKVWATTTRAFFTTEAFVHYRIDNESSSVNNPGKVMNVCYEYEEIEKYLRAHDLFDELCYIMESAKFGAYYWNFLRLKARLLKPFIICTKTEFTTANEQHLLIQNYFVPNQWRLLQYILHHSIFRISFHLRFVRLAQKLKSAAKRLFLTLRPTYRKQKLISDLISELYAENDLLTNRLQMLELTQHSDSSLQSPNYTGESHA